MQIREECVANKHKTKLSSSSYSTYYRVSGDVGIKTSSYKIPFPLFFFIYNQKIYIYILNLVTAHTTSTYEEVAWILYAFCVASKWNIKNPYFFGSFHIIECELCCEFYHLLRPKNQKTSGFILFILFSSLKAK